MATERQIEANRRNAGRSTGPKSAGGKARCRGNATKHGLAGASAMVEAGLSAAFEARRAKWSAEFRPVGEAGGWALDRAVAASLRIERCERAMDGLTEVVGERARLAWDEDRAVEAATVAGRLARDPVLASRQLQASLAGVELLVDSWLGLVEALEARGDWSESEASTALDLLGVAAELRAGRTPIDAPEGGDLGAFRRGVALGEVDRLEGLRDEALTTLDEMERRQAMAGDVALLSRPAKLLLRYERDAWRRFRESIREVRDSADSSGLAPSGRTGEPAPCDRRPSSTSGGPDRVASPRDGRRTEAIAARSSSAERGALLAEVAPFRSVIDERLRLMGLDVDDLDSLDEDEIDRRLGELDRAFAASLPGGYVPIAVGARAAGG